MNDRLKAVLNVASAFGDVTEFHRYGSGYIFVEGVTSDGRRFSITVSDEITDEEEKENA